MGITKRVRKEAHSLTKEKAEIQGEAHRGVPQYTFQ